LLWIGRRNAASKDTGSVLASRRAIDWAINSWVLATSPNPAYRFALIGLAFLLLNLWGHLCWLYTQVAHRGRRAFAPSLFRQARFINFLKHALERIYGTVNKIRAPAAPLL
jgi:hypothetical protein